MSFRDAYEKEGPSQSYTDWLNEELNTQLDILAESSRRLHHIIGPLSLALRLAEELERETRGW
jgi:hypothetical protein